MPGPAADPQRRQRGGDCEACPVPDAFRETASGLRDVHSHFTHQKLNIFPGLLLRGRVPQEIRRMVGADYLDSMVIVEFSTKVSDGSGRVQQALRSDCAETADELRPDQFQLTVEERAARGRLVRQGVPIARRAALERIEDVHVFAAQPRIPLVMISVRSFPARPTKGTPCRSSSAPGASPMKTSRAFGLPSPKTVCVRVEASSAQAVHAATSFANWARSMLGSDPPVINGSLLSGGRSEEIASGAGFASCIRAGTGSSTGMAARHTPCVRGRCRKPARRRLSSR